MAAPLSKAEKSYVQASLKASPPLRADGRALTDFRAFALETGVAPLANGSSRVRIEKMGTEVLAAAKLEVEDVGDGCEGEDGGRVVCSVTCLPSAYPHLSPGALDDLSYDMTGVLHAALAHRTLHPANLGIVRARKSWLLHLDCVVRADAGNAYDALFVAARAALWDTKVPRTRAVEYRPREEREKGEEEMDTAGEGGMGSGLDTREVRGRATDFEMPDYWDEGEVLDGRDRWPVCLTLNILPPLYYLDASMEEEASTPSRLLLFYSFPPSKSARPVLQGMRLLGPGELDLALLKTLLGAGEKHAQTLHAALDVKMREEDLRRGEKARVRFAGAR